MRTVIVAMLLMCIPLGHARAFASEHPISDAAVREATRLAHRDALLAAQAAAPPGQRSAGHPVRNGALIGAGAGAILVVLGNSCGPEEDLVCGQAMGLGLVLGAGMGAGIGALIGLAFKKFKH